VRVERKQMCGPHPFVTTGSFPVFHAVHTKNALPEFTGRSITLSVCKEGTELNPLQIKVAGLGGYFFIYCNDVSTAVLI
jgi:hypothetical protein